MRVSRALVRPVLQYACETWTALDSEVRRLEVFERRCLREMLPITLRDRVRNERLLEAAGGEGVAEVLVRSRWRWLGHVLRMQPDRVASRALRLDMQAMHF